MPKRIYSYLSKEEHDIFLKVCESEGCKPYGLVKVAVLDLINSYPLKKPKSEEPTSERPAEEKGPTGTPGSPTLEKASSVAETVKRIIEGKPVE